MIAKSLRAKVVDDARRDAAAYYREFRSAVGAEATGWVTEAWADLRRDLKLPPETADQLWPAYWEAFSKETARLASKSAKSPSESPRTNGVEATGAPRTAVEPCSNPIIARRRMPGKTSNLGLTLAH
jgi:hypothetical protein